jgi:hypothetical protein
MLIRCVEIVGHFILVVEDRIGQVVRLLVLGEDFIEDFKVVLVFD